MKELLLKNKLIEIEINIEHQKSPILRAETLLDLLRIEQANLNNIDLLRSTLQGLNEMLSAMNKVELLSEINSAILILTHYMESGSFSLIALPRNNIDKMDADCFKRLNERLEGIVDKFNNDTALFFD
ncbi:MAG TPA: hypothetical protein VIK55_17515 [Paludibacter sp.]